ncbi:MAG: GNAT family N-acetyltransferase [Burkholderiaceae bacterium]
MSEADGSTPFPAQAQPSRWRYRPACVEDCAGLTELAIRSKASWGYDAGFMAACADELTVRPEALTSATRIIELVHQGGAPLGFMSVAIQTDDAELEAMFVLPEALRGGVGRRLMALALRACARHGRHLLTIQSDPFAEGFYRRMGALPVGRRESDSVAGRFLPLLALPLEIVIIQGRAHALWLWPGRDEGREPSLEAVLDGEILGHGAGAGEHGAPSPGLQGAPARGLVANPITSALAALRSRHMQIAGAGAGATRGQP